MLTLALYFLGNITFVSSLFIFLSTLLALLSTFYSSLLQSFKFFALAGLVLVVGSIVKLLGGYIIIQYSPQLQYLYLITILSVYITIILGRKISFHNEKPGNNNSVCIWHPFSSYLRRKNIIIPLLASIGLVGLINIDVILVKKFFDSDQSGLYAAVSLLGKIILYISGPISLVAFSFFTGHESKSKSKKILIVTAITFICFGLLSVMGYYYFSESVVTYIFGTKYLEIAPIIFLAAIFGALHSLVTLFTQYLIAKTSRASVLTLLTFLLQTVLIYTVHDTMQEVLVINIITNSVLCCALAYFSLVNIDHHER